MKTVSFFGILEMIKLPIGKAMFAAQKLGGFSQLLVASSDKWSEGSKMNFPVDQFQFVKDSATDFSDACTVLELQVSAKLGRDLTDEYEKLPIKNGLVLLHSAAMRQILALLNTISQVFQRESVGSVGLILGVRQLQLYEPEKPLFGEQVQEKFPTLIYEIEEAGKCLALDRSTAAAFHSIRCLEVGITAISRCLSIPDPSKGAERNWKSLLNKVKAEIDRRWSTPASRFSGDGAAFEALYAVLVAMQNPYRNATMHFDQQYTKDDSAHIFAMVGGVMRKIASRMDEQGQPLA